MELWSLAMQWVDILHSKSEMKTLKKIDFDTTFGAGAIDDTPP